MNEVLSAAGNIQFLNPLKRDDTISSYLGESATDGKRVLVKVISLKQLSAEERNRLEHEGPSSLQVGADQPDSGISYFEKEDLYYLIRPFIPGVTLTERLAQGSLSVKQTLDIGRSIMTSLRSAHRNGVRHLDIKPSNLILQDDGAVLLDYSPFRRRPSASPLKETPMEGLSYMAPEYLGLMDREIGDTTDLYSAGAVLYECLTGRPPFEGASTGEILRKHITVRPTGLRLPGLAIPLALEEVILRLLAKDPQDRYQSAEGALADLAAIRGAMEKGVPEPAVFVGSQDRRKSLTEPAFIGRYRELEEMESGLDRAFHGQGDLTYVEAPSGTGKTWLFDELSRRAVRKGAWILRGHCVSKQAQRPFDVLSGVVAEIVSKGTDDPVFAHTLRMRMGDQRNAACDSLPELSVLLGPGSPPGSLGPESLGESRSLIALATLLDSLGSPQSPAVILLDDYQWADTHSVKLLGQWQIRTRSQEGADRHSLIMVAFRSEEVSPDHILRRIRPATHLMLHPFSMDDVRHQAESMAGRLPGSAVETVRRLSDGNPFMVSAVLAGLVESGAVFPSSDGWRVDEEAMATAQSSRQSAAILVERIERLPPTSIRLLSAGAILGREFQVAQAEELIGYPPGESAALLDEACQRHILWAGAPPGRYGFTHDKLREILLEMLPEADRVLLHQVAAEKLEATDRSLVFDLAYHFDAGGRPGSAFPYALEAAEQARSRHALELAERHYRIAERGAPEKDMPARFRIFLGLGDVLAIRGDYGEGRKWFEQARTLAPDTLRQAMAEARIGDLSFKRSDYPTAIVSCTRGLNLLGRRIPWKYGFPALVLWEIVVQVAHTLFPRLFVGRRALGTERSKADLLSVALYERLSFLWYFTEAAKSQVGWTAMRALNLVEQYPPTPELGHTYSVVSNVSGNIFPPLVSWSYALRERALSVQKSLGSLHGQGQAMAYSWPSSYLRMEFEDGIARAREGKKLLARAGDQWDVGSASWGIALCMYLQGNIREAVREAKALIESAHAIGDLQNAGNAIWIWSRASDGDVPDERIREYLHRKDLFVATRISILGAEGIRQIAEGRPEEALETLGEACHLGRKAGIIDNIVGGVLPWHATALRLSAERASPLDVGKRRQLLKRAQRAAFLARNYGRLFRHILPHALRESGRIAVMMGKPGLARKYLDACQELSGRYGLRYELARCLQTRGEIGKALDWPEHGKDREQYQKLQIELGMGDGPGMPKEEGHIPATLGLVDRYSTLLDKGRSIAVSLNREMVFSKAKDAGLALLRADNCWVLDFEAHGDSSPPFQESDFARALCTRALEKGSPLLLNIATSGEQNEEAKRLGVKSALAAPILARGRAEGCLYASHHLVAGAFGEEEIRLSGFITALAGAALENSIGVAELEAMHKSMQGELERLVEVRTRELQVANKELEAFSYSVSHDLRAPLRAIDGFSQALLKNHGGTLNAQGQEDLHRVRAGAQRMAQLIDDLLSLSRVSRAEMVREKTDLSAQVRSTIDQLREANPERRVEFLVQEGIVAMGDPRLIRVVLVNLLDNAFKFTGKKENAHIEFGALLEKEGPVYFVRDDGVGFDMRYADKLFGAFQRLHSRAEFEGTGIGLATVQRIIHRHGGKVWTEAEPGKGATFFFTLPGS